MIPNKRYRLTVTEGDQVTDMITFPPALTVGPEYV